jgi:hypothetical protein
MDGCPFTNGLFIEESLYENENLPIIRYIDDNIYYTNDIKLPPLLFLKCQYWCELYM